MKTLLLDIAPKTTTADIRKNRQYELESLITTHGGMDVCEVMSRKMDTDLKLFLRKGILEEIVSYCQANSVQRVVLGNILKPRQIYELSEIFRTHKVEIWDKVDLILHIFSLHAQSAEAKLQIQLAKIRHMGPRIFGLGGAELSKQGGGSKNAKGQGETNTEVMKRHLQKEERQIIEKLKQVSKTKCLHRQNRKRNHKQSISLVGYTNAGKSSLMNVLSKKGVSVKDALFQTLDTRVGLVFLPKSYQEVFLSDTIGFIADLPPDLISAFASTLAESVHADLLLHVVDVSDPLREEKIAVVDDILDQLGIADKKQILVFNKTDQAGVRFGKIALQKKYSQRTPVFVSAHQKLGIDELRNMIEKQLPEGDFEEGCCTR